VWRHINCYNFHNMPASAFRSAAYWRRKFFFSAAERSLYQVLRRLIPAYTVFAKVRFCDLISASAQKRAGRHQRRIESKQLDFLICDATLAPVMAVEVDDGSPGKRDQMVDAALAAVDVPVVHIPTRRCYGLEEVRQWVFPELQACASIR
jgi:Protein of unknown function (DUF2726)